MSQPPTPPPPIAKVVPHVTELHGDGLQDDYRWLQAKEDPEVLAYLEAENAHVGAAFLEPTAALRERLYAEMLGRIKEDDQSAPYPSRGYWYYTRTETGLAYPIYCRRAGSMAAPEEVLLDLNALAAGLPFLAVGLLAISDDSQRMAYSVDVTGFREYTLRVKDLRTGELFPEAIERVSTAAWTADSSVLLYVTEDAAKRPYRLWRHRLGEAGDDPLLLEETDQRFRLGVRRTRTRAWLVATSRSHTTSESRLSPAGDGSAPWTLVAAREADHEYDVEDAGDRLVIRTNGGGRRNFRLVDAPLATPGPEHWRELQAHDEAVMLEGVEAFADHLVVEERAEGLPRLRVIERATGVSHHVAFPDAAYEVGSDANAEYVTGEFRFQYESPVTPSSVFAYDLAARALRLLKRQEVLGGFDPARYRVERRHAVAPDGVRVPISLVRPVTSPSDAPVGPGPLLLVGYGAYGFPYPAVFSSARLSLLDRGVSVAIAHVRGGGELGKRWHDAGRLHQKRNTFTDFIAAADHLAAAGVTAPDRVAIQGGSAGGLLIGAVLNMRPDLCRAALLIVPFVDVVNTMLDDSLPLTVGEYEEWGNPRVRDDYLYMRGYDPCQNLAALAYPATLVRTALHDSQVMYWEPAKYVARRRALTAGAPALYFHVNLAAGHGGASGRYDALRETAIDYAFVLTQLGLAERAPR